MRKAPDGGRREGRGSECVTGDMPFKLGVGIGWETRVAVGGRTWGVYITSVKRCSPWSIKALLSEPRAPVLSLGSCTPQTFTEHLLCAGHYGRWGYGEKEGRLTP